jgi:SAM-dependent methyltransferase
MASHYHCDVVAVEPSALAIADGQAAHPEVRFVRGTAAQSSLEASETFDVIIVNFVLHWVDRSLLERSLAEIERRVTPGGLLIVGDFLPRQPYAARYHHLPGQDVWTFKEDYPSLFIERGDWELVALITGTMSGSLVPDTDDRDRSGWALLRRSGGSPSAPPDEVA